MDTLLRQHFREKMDSYYPISANSLEELLNFSTLVHLKATEVLIQQGSRSRQFFFLDTGYMVSYISDEKGRSYNKNIFVQRDWVSSMVSNIMQKPSEFTLKAVTDCVLISIPYKKFRELIFQKEDLKLFYIHYLEKNWVIEKEEREVSIVMDDALARYQKLILRHPDLENYVPLQDIASHLGITPTQLSRIRKQLK